VWKDSDSDYLPPSIAIVADDGWEMSMETILHWAHCCIVADGKDWMEKMIECPHYYYYFSAMVWCLLLLQLLF
jgi:hypothetical protein